MTVPGNVSSLCAPPDYMIGLPKSSMPSICQVIMEGSTDTKADACCPYGLSLPVNPNVPYQPQLPQCSQTLTSPYRMALSSVSSPYTRTITPGGALYADYTFSITSTGFCNADVINQCCNMAVDRVQVTLASSAMVVRTQLNGATMPASLLLVKPVATASSSSALGGGAQLTTMTVSNLGIDGKSSTSASLVLTVRLPAGVDRVPDICASGSPATSTVGNFAYSLLPPVSTAMMCCPASNTLALAPSVVPVSPSTCAPSVSAPLASATMGFNFHEGPVPTSATSTKFTFMVYVQQRQVQQGEDLVRRCVQLVAVHQPRHCAAGLGPG